MKLLPFGCLIAALAVTGCVSKSRAKAEARAAYLQGLHDAQRQLRPENQKPFVTVRGDVQRGMIEWHDQLTLSRALVAAGYRGLSTPRDIIVSRKGESFHVSPRQLLASQQDPLLEPGDVIEVMR